MHTHQTHTLKHKHEAIDETESNPVPMTRARKHTHCVCLNVVSFVTYEDGMGKFAHPLNREYDISLSFTSCFGFHSRFGFVSLSLFPNLVDSQKLFKANDRV